MPDLAHTAFRRICVIKPSALGDIMHALPVLDGLRRQYPTAYIAWIVNRGLAPVLAGHPQLDEVIPFDRDAFRSLRGCLGMTITGWRFARGLRDRRFDLAIDLQGLFRSGLLTRATAATVRLGFKPAREGAGLFYTASIPAPDPEEHAIDKNCRVGGVLGVPMDPQSGQLPVDRAAHDRIRQRLAEGFGRAPADYVVVVPGSRWETKNWPAARFGDVVERLVDSGRHLVVAGGPDDRFLGTTLAARGRNNAVCDLTGRTTLPELVALIAGAQAVLANDSGPLHLAVALNRPVVALFGPTAPQRTGPYRPGARVLLESVDCSPCYLRRLRDCPHDHACMTRLHPDRVVQAVTEACATFPATRLDALTRPRD